MASHDWTNWSVKKEPLWKFGHLPALPKRVIELDSPSPLKRRATSSLSSSVAAPFVPNPDHAELGLPADEEDEANLEEALEQLMDDMVMPPVGKAPEDM